MRSPAGLILRVVLTGETALVPRRAQIAFAPDGFEAIPEGASAPPAIRCVRPLSQVCAASLNRPRKACAAAGTPRRIGIRMGRGSRMEAGDSGPKSANQ